jgi:hypothetical protein
MSRVRMALADEAFRAADAEPNTIDRRRQQRLRARYAFICELLSPRLRVNMRDLRVNYARIYSPRAR